MSEPLASAVASSSIPSADVSGSTASPASSTAAQPNGVHSSAAPPTEPRSSSSALSPSSSEAPPPPSSSASRERDREKERDRDRRRSSRDRDGGDRHSRDRGGDRDRDRDRKRSRHSDSRSRSRSPSHRSSKSTSASSSSRTSHPSSRSRSPQRAPPPPVPRGSDDMRVDVSERQRAELTIFVSQVHPSIKERDLFEFFSHCGRVEDVRLIRDQKTRRSKGLGYVEFRAAEDVIKALALAGQLLGGYPINVQAVQYPMSREVVQSVGIADGLRLYVGSLQYQITEADIRPIFESFGPIDSIEVHKDPATGISKGFGFVQYRHKADAEIALKALQGVDLAGRPMKLGLATPAGTPPASMMMSHTPYAVPSPSLSSPSTSSSFPSSSALPQPPSPCLLIANMFDPREETEPEWDVDIALEMKEESAKYGQLLHVHVDRQSQGHVYLRFAAVEGAMAAFAALHGRWFGGRQLVATYIPEQTYRQLHQQA